MKFLSELRTCCGGATIRTVMDGLPPVEKKESELVNRSGNKRVVSRGRKLRKTENWKPALHVISEDKAIADVDRYSYDKTTVGNSGNKRALKDAGRAPKRFGHGYWKMSYAVAMPAFSGMLF
ncbi:uncharacterized protein LOC125867949 [Solanum stenotomum]|uniref:uncharacterized protein LOC125867949 n=1 Tax=Solanum stenotomum TaxID=172797 RepID=UPI0020D0F8FC|nr:uncharacterized protein LOC125867949 [Solanum stenotomum]